MSILTNRVILITGGTGSFGNAMAYRAIQQGAKEIRIFSRDEAKQEEMRIRMHDQRVRFYLGDVRNRASLDAPSKGAELVFHAAALKQVPSCEFFPMQAVLTNIVGSAHVVDSATAAGAECVVLLSTDKAVAPINAMGMTKALMEKVFSAASRGRTQGDTRLSGVRYGNVMFSRGSVLPSFIAAACRGMPFRITHPDMTRFLLPLSAAVELVETAMIEGHQGDLFIRKAPAATIRDMATAIAAALDVPLAVEQLGVRHGEKMHETLATREELARAEESSDHWRVMLDDRDLNYSLYCSEGSTELQGMDYTSENTRRLTAEELTSWFSSMPEIRERASAELRGQSLVAHSPLTT